MICPLSCASDGNHGSCVKEKCALFMEAPEICAIKSMAIAADNIHDKLDIIYDAIHSLKEKPD